jgi:hypothetical protein
MLVSSDVEQGIIGKNINKYDDYENHACWQLLL